MSPPTLRLSAAADDRKARLAHLRNVKRKRSINGEPESTAERKRAEAPADAQEQLPASVDVARTYVSGRNYDPETRGPKLGYDAPPTLALTGPTLEEQAADMEADVRQRSAADAADDKGIDLFKLQPKKSNWYLRRHLDRRLEVLNVRTDNAIARIVRERITNEQAQKRERQTAGNMDIIAPANSSLWSGSSDAAEGDQEEAAVDGIALIEGLRAREKEDAEEIARERAAEEEVEQEARVEEEAEGQRVV